MAVPDGWFPQFAPSGLYLACGTTRLSVMAVARSGSTLALSTVTDVGEGIAPHWYNPGGAPADQLLYYNRAAALMAVPTPPPFVAQFFQAIIGFNAYGAGGGVWAGYHTVPPTVYFSDGTSTPGALSIPSGNVVDQDGRTVFLTHAGQTLYLRSAAGVITVADTWSPGIQNPHISTQGYVWQRYVGGIWTTYGNRGSGIEALHVAAGLSEYAVPIDTPVGPWILAYHYSGQLYLRAWGQTTVRLVATGFTNFPHAWYSSAEGGFYVAWSDEGGALQTAFLVVDVTTAEQPTTPAPIPGGGGSGSGPGGSVPLDVRTLTITPAVKYTPPRHRVYPHVAEVTDKPAQQTIKLLWDKVQELQERLEVGDIAKRFTAVEASVSGTNVRIDEQEDQLEGDPAETQVTQIPGGGATGPVGPPPPPGTGGGGGTTASCADSPGTGHYDPGGALTQERARKIVCGTGDEWSNLRVATADLATRESNAEILVRRMIWHLQQGGYNAGRQQNPSTAISKDKLALVIGTETRAFDVFSDFDTFTNILRVQWSETFPAVLVADSGIAD